uniref:Serine/threonine-protein phosphatase n=1 Tax=Setaria digitata TaxID=48799 RepID=A0A915PR23_9BILA
MRVVETSSPLFPTFNDNDLIMILHNVQEIYAEEPIMLEFDLPKNGLIVVGDLHGDLYSLLNIILKYGLPPNTNYLFLGDYVDRGLYQVELILFIFLMKLRWPNYVTTLKGNHEDYQCCKAYEFYDECLRIFKRGRRWFTLINHVFDHMPVCAIISNHFFLCHGGISQWLTCRNNIKNISKPTYTNDMYFVEGVLLADLLWADPVPNQIKWFDLSHRNCGYSFNQNALCVVLHALQVKTLIRGHEYYPGGTARNFGNNTCYTVHSTTDHHQIYEPYTNELAERTQIILQQFFLSTIISYNRLTCRWCKQPYPLYVTRRKRCFIYADIFDYMIRNGRSVMYNDETYMKLYWTGSRISLMKRAIELFPITNDIIFGKPTDNDIPRSFRICILTGEYKLMKRIYQIAGKDFATRLEPKFQDICVVDTEIQAPSSRFQKLKKTIKLAMGLEPRKLETEGTAKMPTALPLLPFHTVGNYLGDVNDDINENGSEQMEEPEEESEVSTNIVASDILPLDSTHFHKFREYDETLDNFIASDHLKIFDVDKN